MAYVYPAPETQQELLYNSTSTENNLIFDVTFQEAKTTLSAGVLQLYDPAGAAIGSTLAMTVSDAQATYTLDTTDTDTYTRRENYIAKTTFTTSAGSTVTRQGLFDIVHTKLYPMLTEDHLQQMDPDILDQLPTSMSTPARFITEAWERVKFEIRARGNRPSLIMSSGMLIQPHKHMTMTIFYEYSSHIVGDTWEAKREFHWDQWVETFAKAMSNAKYDSGQDGTAGEVKNLWQIRGQR